MDLEGKIMILEEYLNKPIENHADSFRTDILFFIDEFNISNSALNFLNKLETKKEIENWVDKLTSRIVLKFEKENEQIGDYIFDYMELG